MSQQQPQVAMSVPPEEIARYRNEILREPLREASPLINSIWPDRPEAAAIGWQDMSQKAIDAWSQRMFSRMATVGGGAATPEVFADPDGREPLRWYLYGWIMGYARRGAGEACHEADVIAAASKLGTDISGTLAAVTRAHTACAVGGQDEECASMAAGHVILSSLTKGNEPSYSAADDAEGFADGWWQARADGLGADTWGIAADGTKSPDAKVTTNSGDTASLFPDAFMEAPADARPAYAEEDAMPADAGDTDAFFAGSLGLQSNDTFGFSADDDFDAFSDTGGTQVPLPAPASLPFDVPAPKEAPSAGDSGTVVIASRSKGASAPQVPALMELPPKLRAHVKSCVTMALRACRGILQELLDAGMSEEAAGAMKEALSTASSKYAAGLLASAHQADGVPKEAGGAEPVLTYAHSWVHGYASVMTDGDWSEHEITQHADQSTLGAADIDDDMSRIVDRCSWEGAPAECADVTIDHLIVVMSPHGRDFPLAHPLYSTRRYSSAGDADGFADGWWKATYDMRQELSRASEAQVRSMTSTGDADDAAAPDLSDTEAGTLRREIGGGASRAEADPYVMSVVDELRNEEEAGRIADEVTKSVSDIPMPFAASDDGDDRSPQGGPSHPRHPEPMDPSDKQVADYLNRLAKRASGAVEEIIAQRADGMRQFRQALALDGEETSRWIQGVASSTYEYAQYLATVCGVNPLRTKDGTDPMLSYADGMICGSMTGALGRGVIDRIVMGSAAKYGVSLSGPVLDRVEYVNRLCASGNGFVRPTPDEASRREANNRIRFQYVMHEAARLGRADVFDADGYNWRGDADGFMVGMRVGKKMQAARLAEIEGK